MAIPLSNSGNWNFFMWTNNTDLNLNEKNRTIQIQQTIETKSCTQFQNAGLEQDNSQVIPSCKVIKTRKLTISQKVTDSQLGFEFDIRYVSISIFKRRSGVVKPVGNGK